MLIREYQRDLKQTCKIEIKQANGYSGEYR